MGQGVLFAINTNGTSFTNLYSFSAGSAPTSLLLSNDILYGTVQGSTGYYDFPDQGSVFVVHPDGTEFDTLHAFTGATDGAWPNYELVLLTNVLYGTTFAGGSNGEGTLFKLNADGSGFTNLHSFTALIHGYATNADGAEPFGSLVTSRGVLYGSTVLGGPFASGILFAFKSDGTGFTNLYNFTGGNDGAGPGELIMSGNILYGAAHQGGPTGNGTIFSLAIVPVTAPVIITQPLSRTNIAGNTASFSVVAKATGPLNYRWLKGGQLMPQQTNSLLSLTQVSDADAATYTAIVTNAAGSVTSNPAILTIVDPPLITSQPSNRTNLAGTSATFSVAAKGTSPLLYRWLKGTVFIAQQTNTTLTLANVSDADAARYSVVITNVAGSITSAPAILTVVDRPSITKQPLSRTNLAGSAATFTVAANGTSPLSYQWFKGTPESTKYRNNGRHHWPCFKCQMPTRPVIA